MTTPPGILRLPAEIRQEIFLAYIRSIIIYLQGPCRRHDAPEKEEDTGLAILLVCRQFYREAEPLLLPNVDVYCGSNAAVLKTLLMKLGPERTTRLRRLRVSHIPVGFNLEPYGGVADDDRDEDEDDDPSDKDLDDWYNGIPSGVRHFHLGAILGLFPGLQLDLLEVFNGTNGSPVTGEQTTECFGSLLETDGYRRLWMVAATGDGAAWGLLPSTNRWKEAIERRFSSQGSGVEIKLDEYDWPYVDTNRFWQHARDAGIILNPPEVESGGESDEVESLYRIDSKDVADIVADRGDGTDYVVKPDNQVLRCIGRSSSVDESPEFFEAASNALRKLVRENSWESISAMGGFDDGTLGEADGYGNRVYNGWW